MTKFGSSGIRGPYGTVVTEDLAFRLGAAVALTAGRVVVGRDARTSSPSLARALQAGVLSVGGVATDAGCLPTPSLAFAARDFDAGLVVTASHNPPEDNGFKFWNPDGSAFDARQRAAVETALRAESPVRVDDRAAVPLAGVIQRHGDAILAAVPPAGRRLKIVLDAGNGPGGLLTPGMLRRAGHQVVTLHADLDGLFRGRPSEPKPSTLGDLSALVPAIGADLGLAHDGDADRLVACDERGQVLDGDATLALLARAVHAKDLVLSVDTSQTVARAMPDARITYTKVGDAYVSERLKIAGGAAASRAFGGEPSGAYIFPSVSYCPDGPHAAVALASLVSREGPLSALASALPRMSRLRDAVRVPPAAMAAVVEDVAARLASLGKVSTLDGARLDTDEGWVLVRASGTEPKVRLMVEARDEATLAALAQTARKALDAAVAERA